MDSTQLHDLVSQANVLHAEKVKKEKGPTKRKGKVNNSLKGVGKGGDMLGLVPDDEMDDPLDDYDSFL